MTDHNLAWQEGNLRVYNPMALLYRCRNWPPESVIWPKWLSWRKQHHLGQNKGGLFLDLEGPLLWLPHCTIHEVHVLKGTAHLDMGALGQWFAEGRLLRDTYSGVREAGQRRGRSWAKIDVVSAGHQLQPHPLGASQSWMHPEAAGLGLGVLWQSDKPKVDIKMCFERTYRAKQPLQK